MIFLQERCGSFTMQHLTVIGQSQSNVYEAEIVSCFSFVQLLSIISN
jgi:hypothetical protein